METYFRPWVGICGWGDNFIATAFNRDHFAFGFAFTFVLHNFYRRWLDSNFRVVFFIRQSITRLCIFVDIIVVIEEMFLRLWKFMLVVNETTVVIFLIFHVVLGPFMTWFLRFFYRGLFWLLFLILLMERNNQGIIWLICCAALFYVFLLPAWRRRIVALLLLSKYDCFFYPFNILIIQLCCPI